MEDKKIKMVALDLDGTTLNSQKEISPRTITAFQNAMRKGTHIVVSTGRTFRSLPAQLFGIEGLEYIVTSNGAHITCLLYTSTLDVKVTRVDQKRGRAVFSHKIVLNEEKQKKIAAIWEGLHVDDIVEGTVMRFTDYGAFVDLGGIDGLLHISEISWGKLKHPQEVLQIGDTVKAVSYTHLLALKSEIKAKWREFLKFCRDNRKTTLLVLAAVLLITVLQIASFFSRSGSYITDENGRIIAIAREDADEVLSVPVKVKAVRGSLQTEQNLILSLSGKEKAASRKTESMSEDCLLYTSSYTRLHWHLSLGW